MTKKAAIISSRAVAFTINVLIPSQLSHAIAFPPIGASRTYARQGFSYSDDLYAKHDLLERAIAFR